MANDDLGRELLDMAGDPVLADAVRNDLQRLSHSESREVAGLARDLLQGRMSLRAVGRSSAYATPLTEGIAAFNRHLAGMTPEERTQFFEEAKRNLRDQRSKVAEQPDSAAGVPSPRDPSG